MALGGHAATMSIQQQQQLTKLSQNRTLPKWSFGGRRGGVGLRHTSPGPGSYGEALGGGGRESDTSACGWKASVGIPYSRMGSLNLEDLELVHGYGTGKQSSLLAGDRDLVLNEQTVL